MRNFAISVLKLSEFTQRRKSKRYGESGTETAETMTKYRNVFKKTRTIFEKRRQKENILKLGTFTHAYQQFLEEKKTARYQTSVSVHVWQTSTTITTYARPPQRQALFGHNIKFLTVTEVINMKVSSWQGNQSQQNLFRERKEAHYLLFILFIWQGGGKIK